MNIQLSHQLYLKPEYLNHNDISGNKLRKLKYNILKAQEQGFSSLLTFGGAFSNHIAAVAAAGKIYGFNTIGIIRGEELKEKINSNPTLLFAKQNGMVLKFVSRDSYREKKSKRFINDLQRTLGDFYLIPEGGTNSLAVKGCEEILTNEDAEFDYICCPVGTGGTISGIINASKPHQKILGFPALKGGFLSDDICKFAKNNRWELINNYHFGGYAKINSELISFINTFKKTYHIPLDPIYTGKMMFGIFDLLEKGYFSKTSKILTIHTGGLQGISGMNKKLSRKNMPLIE